MWHKDAKMSFTIKPEHLCIPIFRRLEVGDTIILDQHPNVELLIAALSTEAFEYLAGVDIMDAAHYLKLDDADAVTHMAKLNRFKTVRWLMHQGVTPDVWVVAWFAKHGDLFRVTWLIDNGAPVSNAAIAWAAGAGHLDVVKSLFGKVPIDSSAIMLAIENGHLEVVQWLIQTGAPRNTMERACAEMNGHIDIVGLLTV